MVVIAIHSKCLMEITRETAEHIVYVACPDEIEMFISQAHVLGTPQGYKRQQKSGESAARGHCCS